MEVEHIAFNVKEPQRMADWYIKHLGLKLAFKKSHPNLMLFLADDAGRVVLELYGNPKAVFPDYASKDPLELHIAFKSSETAMDRDRLLAAGCTLESDTPMEDGSHLAMLRDPFGMCVQLCQRAVPLI